MTLLLDTGKSQRAGAEPPGTEQGGRWGGQRQSSWKGRTNLGSQEAEGDARRQRWGPERWELPLLTGGPQPDCPLYTLALGNSRFSRESSSPPPGGKKHLKFCVENQPENRQDSLFGRQACISNLQRKPESPLEFGGLSGTSWVPNVFFQLFPENSSW